MQLHLHSLAIKLELFQHSGSFKARGAFTNLLTRSIPPAGVAAASGGNHGVAVAYTAMKLGVPARIFAPSISSAAKLRRLKDYGADLVVTGELAVEDGLLACAVVVLVNEGDALLAVEAMKRGAHNCLERNRAQGEELRHVVSQAIEKADRQWWQVTPYMRAEKALRLNEAQPGNVIASSCVFIFIKELNGRYLQVNRWQEAMLGAPEADVSGKTDYDLRAREVADALCAHDPKVIAANMPLQFEEQVALDDGLHHFILVKFPLHDDRGRPYAVCSIATDITERKRTEEVLRKTEERFRTLIEQAADGIIVIDREMTFTEVFSSGCQMLGYTRAELIGKKVADLIHPEDWPRAQELHLDNDPKPKLEECRLRRKDGHYLPVELHCKLFPDGRAVAIVRDITDASP